MSGDSIAETTIWIVWNLQYWLYQGLGVVVFLVCLWALLDCLSRPSYAFVNEGKRTKLFWMALTAGGVLVASYLVATGPSGFIGILLLVLPGVYLADVRPAVRGYSRRRRKRPGGSGGLRSLGPRDW